MYQFKVNNEVVGYSATPRYIKKLDNGNYTQCSVEEADGVAVHSNPYSLEGKATLDDRPVVTFEEVQDTQFFATTLNHYERSVKGEQLLRACYDAGNLTATEMVDNMVLLPDYATAGPNGDYEHPLGECCTYDRQPWRCCQAYNAKNNPDILPGSAAAHWVQFHTTDPVKALPFTHPTGAHNVYMDGECMLYTDGQVYRSAMDNNAYSPDEYAKGWEVVEVAK